MAEQPPLTPDDEPAGTPSPVLLAARLNHFTPRDAVAAEPEAPPRAGVTETSEPPADAGAPPSFRDAVRRREGRAELLLFRIGQELFALALDHVDEATEVDAVHPVPEASGASLGVVELRGRMIPLVSPAGPLGVEPGARAAMLVLRDGVRRVGVAVDDVDDVLSAELSTLRAPPDGDTGDGILLAMARRGSDLVGVLDAEALLAACLAESRSPETAA